MLKSEMNHLNLDISEENPDGLTYIGPAPECREYPTAGADGTDPCLRQYLQPWNDQEF